MFRRVLSFSLVAVLMIGFSVTSYAFKVDGKAEDNSSIDKKAVDKRQAEYDNNIKKFNIRGITFGATVKEFRAKFLNAVFEKNESNDMIGENVYVVSNLEKTSVTQFRFFEDKLYYINAVYDNVTDWQSFKSTFEVRYGKFSEKISDDVNFNGYIMFNNVGRYMQFTALKNNDVAVAYVDWFTARKFMIKLDELTKPEMKK